MMQRHAVRTGRPVARAPLAMVATSHELATTAGLRALYAGGSAVDAAIAANAVLCVAYPHMAGLGGDGFWLIQPPDEPRPLALDASGPAAAGADRAKYREEGEEIPSRGPKAALTVPGAVDGWREAHERFGRLGWSELFEDAIRYARDGLPVSRSVAAWSVKDEEILGADDAAARIFLQDGRARAVGSRLVMKDLARSLERIALEGARPGFYEGAIADRFCDALADRGSPLRADDFAAYHAEWVEPLSTTYRGREVFEFPPATQGFAALQVLNLMEGFDVAAWGDGTADYYHHLAEAVKVSFADRDAWLTDPRFVDIPLDRLISKEYADERRRLIDPSTALDMEAVEPGIEWDTERRRDAASSGRRSPRGDTTYFCVVDRDGLVASVIQSIYHDFGTAVVAGETGIIPQNRGSFFSLDDDHPNRLEPGKRTFHTIIPAMLVEDGRPAMAFGSMGGEGQPQTHAALLTRMLDFGYDVQQAIEAPRWLMGRTWGVESRDLSLEGRIPDEVVRELERRGQPVKVLPDWDDNMGHAAAIRIDREHGFLEGGADPRGDGIAAGY